MVMRPNGISVILAVPPRLATRVRSVLDSLDPACARATRIDTSGAPIAAIAADARSAAPSRGVVVVVEDESDVEPQIAAGADEVVVGPVEAQDLERALRRAAVRAGVRDDHAVEARMLEQVLQGVAHGAEAPLAAIALDVDALRSGALEQRAFEEADTALEDCGNAVEQVARVLREAAVLTTGSAREHRDTVNVGPLVEQVLRILGGSSALRAHIEVHRDADLPDVHAPRRLLARTIAQVIVQALDAVPADEPPALRRLRATLRTLPDAAAIAFEVRPGLDAPPPSSRMTLGLEGRLAVLRAALRSFDGELVAERAKDGGVRLVVFVPRVKSGETRPPPRGQPFSATAPFRPRVLVVDPDERVLRAAARALGDRFDVLLATSGEEALAIAREGSLDLAVLDLRVPDMSTDVLADELRRLDAKLGDRIAMVGGQGDATIRPDGAPVLLKPVRRDALISALDGLLSRAPTLSSIPPARLLN
ncbi:MAG: response regulator [Polyangiales bacterium]